MATAESAPINGNYGQPGFDAPLSTNYASTTINNAAGYSASQQQPTQQSTAPTEIPKDEVGWYFVEQYYTTLSKSPDRLYLFYNKRSQYVSGTEEDKVNVCLGQKAINDRIKELDFHETKVRVTNVDSQGSDAHIVIQVIGEISNRSQPHKRFVQTFVLAEQTNGYFVLNDIFRYLAEEPEEEEEQIQQDSAASHAGVQEPAPTAAVPTAAANVGSEDATTEEGLNTVDHKLEEAVQDEPVNKASPPPAAVNGTPVPETAEVAEAEETPAAAVSNEEALVKVPEDPAAAEDLQPEKPKDPAPTPTSAPPKPAPAAAPAPAKPRTWASLAAGQGSASAPKVATPVVPTPQAPSQPKAAAPASSQPLAVPAQASAPAREPSPANSQGEAAGWQTAGHKKEQSRTQNPGPAGEGEQKRAYIKNVYSQVEEGALRSALSKFGDIEYLDISRPKNCAFVDFKTTAGFQNAVNNNPHSVNGLDLKVEERRTRAAQSFGFPRGGAPRGRGGMGGQAARGGFQPRGGRGGSMRGNRGAPAEA